MRRWGQRAAVLACALAALAAGACGSDDEASLTPVEVTRLEASLEAVRQGVASGDRDAALGALRQFRADVEALDDSGEAEAELREALVTGVERTKESISKELPE